MTDEVSISFQISAPNEAALETWAIKHLEERGYSVRAAHQNWETAKEFCARLHVHWQTLDRNMAAQGCPNVIVRRGATGRLIEILSNADFDAFITRNKRRFKADRRDHKTRMQKRRAGRTPKRESEPVMPVTTAQNWKSNQAVDALLSGKDISDRVNRKLGAK